MEGEKGQKIVDVMYGSIPEVVENEREALLVAHGDAIEGDHSLAGPVRSRFCSARVVFGGDAVDVLAAPLDGDELLLGLGEDPDEVGEEGGDAEGVAQREPQVTGVHGAIEAVVLQDGDEGDAADHGDTDHLK